jgi:plastocyanin
VAESASLLDADRLAELERRLDQLTGRRDGLLVFAVLFSGLAVLGAIVGIGFGLRAIDESKDNAAWSGAERRVTTDAAGENQGGAGTLELVAKGIAFDKTTLTAPAGSVSFRFDNQDQGVPHNLHVSGNGVDEKTDIQGGPTTQALTLEVTAGSYTYVCDVHPQQMKGQLTVT